MGIWYLLNGCVPVYFNSFFLIYYTFVGKISFGGSWMSSSSVSMNCQCINITWHNISGW